MSRRRGEFEHRTSIFEGAFRAWSHLGGLEPSELETKTAQDLDPLDYPIENDPRLDPATNKKKGGAAKGGSDDDENDKVKKEDEGGDRSGAQGPPGGGGKRREYPYEALPRSGLAHPFVQAILSPWLGPDADQDAIQLGLTTLRTWWQHRRKGESGSAIAALGTDKMRGVVEGYTRHFFNLAHCLVTNDGEQPPRTLMQKMKELEKARNKRSKKRAREEEAGKLAALALNAGLAHGLTGGAGGPQPGAGGGPGPGGGAGVDAGGALPSDIADDPSLTPLERLHAAQRRQLEQSGGVSALTPMGPGTSGQTIDMRGKCIPGKLDLPGIVGQLPSSQSSQIVHRGALATMSAAPDGIASSSNNIPLANAPSSGQGARPGAAPQSSQVQQQYGDPNRTPVVFVSENGDIQIAMSVEGITCAHCVKIVETVLRGCNGNKSPIDGLLDAAADRVLNSVLIRIDRSSNAKRIAYEAARNLAMVGYTAIAKEMDIADLGCGGSGRTTAPGQLGEKARNDLGMLSTAFEVVASTEPTDVFDWTIPCTCPDNGVLREDCARHSQMNKRIFEAFDRRQRQVVDYMAGCGKQYGGKCTCGPNCKCKNCAEHGNAPLGALAASRQGAASAAGEEGGCSRTSSQSPAAPSAFPQASALGAATSGATHGSANAAELMYQQLQQQQMNLASQAQAQALHGGGPEMGGGVSGLASGMDGGAPGAAYGHGGGGDSGHGGMNARHHLASVMANVHAGAGGGFGHHGAGGGAGGGGDAHGVSRGSILGGDTHSVPRGSVLTWGTGGSGGGNAFNRNMSLTSETTFGRAMSGLSALSIDWENMEDFDVNVDHSAHINNSGMQSPNNRAAGGGSGGMDKGGIMEGCGMMNGGECTCGPSCKCAGCPVHTRQNALGSFPPNATGTRRSSVKKNMQIDPDAQNVQVSFKV